MINNYFNRFFSGGIEGFNRIIDPSDIDKGISLERLTTILADFSKQKDYEFPSMITEKQNQDNYYYYHELLHQGSPIYEIHSIDAIEDIIHHSEIIEILRTHVLYIPNKKIILLSSHNIEHDKDLELYQTKEDYDSKGHTIIDTSDVLGRYFYENL